MNSIEHQEDAETSDNELERVYLLLDCQRVPLSLFSSRLNREGTERVGPLPTSPIFFSSANRFSTWASSSSRLPSGCRRQRCAGLCPRQGFEVGGSERIRDDTERHSLVLGFEAFLSAAHGSTAATRRSCGLERSQVPGPRLASPLFTEHRPKIPCLPACRAPRVLPPLLRRPCLGHGGLHLGVTEPCLALLEPREGCPEKGPGCSPPLVPLV